MTAPDEFRIRRCFILPPTHTNRGGGANLRGVTNIRELNNNVIYRYLASDDPAWPAVYMHPADGSGDVTTLTPADPSDIDNNAYYFWDETNQWVIRNPAGTHRTLAEWRADTGYDLNSTADFNGGGPADFYDVVVNPSETGRGTVRIYKQPGTATMALNLNTILDAGQAFWLYDGRNPLDGAFASGTFTGADVTITFADMPGRAIPTGWTVAPTGNEATHPVVIVRRVGPAWVAPPAALTGEPLGASMYAFVIDGLIRSTGGLPAGAKRLDNGNWITPYNREWTRAEHEACGWFAVVNVAQPADTATHTHDRSVTLVAGVPTVTWTQRPLTPAELTARTETTNESSVRTKLAADMTAMQTMIDVDPATITVTTFPQAQSAARDALRRDKDIARMLKHLGRLQLRLLDGTD